MSDREPSNAELLAALHAVRTELLGQLNDRTEQILVSISGIRDDLLKHGTRLDDLEKRLPKAP